MATLGRRSEEELLEAPSSRAASGRSQIAVESKWPRVMVMMVMTIVMIVITAGTATSVFFLDVH